MKRYYLLFLSALAIVICLSMSVAAASSSDEAFYAEDYAFSIADGVFTEGSVSYDGSYTVTLPQNLSSTANTATVHDVIRQGYSNCDKEINLYSYKLTDAQLKEIITETRDSTPEAFHVSAKYSYSYDGAGTVYALVPNYTMTKSEYSSAMKVFDAEIEKLTTPAKKLSNDLEKVLSFHDSICSEYEYDTSYNIYDAYNMIVNKKGVCQAYTLLMIGCANELGIEMSWAQSTAMNHIWNVVNIDGQYYHLDATWDDPIGNEPFYSRHNYFMLSDAEMLNRKHYSWTSNYVCTSTKYDSSFWDEVRSPFVAVGDELYYIDFSNKSLNSFDGVKFTTKAIETFSYKWYASPGSSGYYGGMWSGLSIYNNLIYYNSADKIFAYDPLTQNTVTVYSQTITDSFVYSSYVENGKLYIYLAQNPNVDGSIFQIALNTSYAVTWSYHGGSTTDNIHIGSIPNYSGVLEPYYLDTERHMVFSHWDKTLTPVMSDTVFNAVYISENHKFVNGECICGADDPNDTPDTPEILNGFVTEDGKLYFYENNVKVKYWFEYEGKTYYASGATNVVINYSKTIGGKYYIWNDETGLEIADGFVFDGTGYKCYENGVNVIGWRHADGSGPKVVNGISEQYSSNPDKLYYFLSTTGYMVTESTYKLGGYIREFNEDHTVKAMNGLQTNGGELYYYVDGVKQTGWHTIDGTTYYFRASDAVYGRAATKWMYIGNKVYYFYASTSATPYALKNEGKIGGIEYTYHTDGYILYNGFVNCDYANVANSNTAANIQKMNGTTRYYKNGEMQTGWQNIGGNWYYFYAIGSANGSGYMCVQSRTIGGVWYEFTETGVCTNK